MKKSTRIMVAVAASVICGAFFFFGCGFTPIAAPAAPVKPAVIAFADMAARVEKSYGTVFEMELTLRGGAPVYSADVIIEGKLVGLYFNAVSGEETGRKTAVALDKDEAAIYEGYSFSPSSASGQADIIVKANSAPQTAAPTQKQQSAKTQITEEKAKEIALAKTGGGTVRKIEKDYEDGKQVYEIEVRYNGVEHEFEIDAATGEILKYKIDD